MTGRREHPTPIRFGTDGWRAVIAEGFTFDGNRIIDFEAKAYRPS